MVETITPVVHGGRAKWMVAVALHVAGAGSTGALFGATLAALGAALGAPFGEAGSAVVATIAAFYLVGELTPDRLPVPQLRQQVPDWWRTFFPAPVAAFLYGAGLGVGFLTYVRHGTMVAVSALAFSSGRPALGASILGVFGVARGVSVVMAAGVRTAEDGRRLVDRLSGSPDTLRRLVNGAALSMLAVAALAAPRIPADGGWQRLAGAVLALVFVWSAGSKIVDRRRWARTVSAHRFPASIDRAVRLGGPIAESVIPLLVALGFARVAAGWAALMLVGFSLELIRVRVSGGGEVPCGCFGGRRSVDLRIALLRNATIAGIAAVAAMAPSSSRLVWPGLPGPGEILPMVLASVGMAVAGLTVWRACVWMAKAARA